MLGNRILDQKVKAAINQPEASLLIKTSYLYTVVVSHPKAGTKPLFMILKYDDFRRCDRAKGFIINFATEKSSNWWFVFKTRIFHETTKKKSLEDKLHHNL